MILTKNIILKLIKSKQIQITPFDIKSVGPASIDLTLDNEFRIFDKKKTIHIKSDADLPKEGQLVFYQNNDGFIKESKFREKYKDE